MTYECKVCWNVNHASRFHCSTCGTIPAQYSIASVPMIERADDYVQIVVAFNAERQTRMRTVKHMLRTVPMDYYAAGE